MINNFLSMGFAMIADHNSAVNVLKERALKEYEDALKMPRKKKKKAKKSALLLYSIACWGKLK